MVPFVATRCCRPFWILPRGHRRAGVTNGEWRRLTSAGEGDSGPWSKESERRTTLTEHSTRTGIDEQHRCPADLHLVHVLVKGKANTATTYLLDGTQRESLPRTIAPSCGKRDWRRLCHSICTQETGLLGTLSTDATRKPGTLPPVCRAAAHISVSPHDG